MRRHKTLIRAVLIGDTLVCFALVVAVIVARGL